MKWDYLVARMRDGGDELFSLQEEMDELGQRGWEFAAWSGAWDVSEGPGPHTRLALFKRPTDSARGEHG